MGFGQGLSGLKGASQRLDVIGNNIANSGTVGFKASTVSFADVYASSRVGLGVQVAAVNQNFSVGTISSTGNQFDLAIDGTDGLFRVIDTSGAVLYTRNGEFYPNKEGFLVNAQGHKLTGMVRNEETRAYGLTPEPIRVPTGNIAARATGANLDDPETGVVFRMNFDAAAKVPGKAFPAFPDNPNAPRVPDPESYNFSAPLTVYDSLGIAHQLTQYFVKVGDNAWDVYYQIDSNDPLTTPHRVNFLSNGKIVSEPEDADTTRYTVEYAVGGGANPLVIPINYAGSTQFEGEYSYAFRQDGFPTGEYASLSFAPDGTVVANYTNGEILEVGYITLASFVNMQGLQPVGGNAWQQTAASGNPTLGRPGTNGMGSIKSQSVEDSNVDMGTELVNMIITQRTYQANAQTISAQSEILQTLLNIR